MSAAETLFDRFRAHMARENFAPANARWLVGYSGGPDSTCLVHMLHRLGIDLVAGYLHHGQRPDADDEQRLCEQFCAERDIPFATGKADVPKLAADLKIGLEEAGRNARYAFFDQAAFRLQCGVVATAHTLTDRVETILLNLARGSGLAGLSGIPGRRGRIVRPLLPFTREETAAYCVELGLPTSADSANLDVRFARVRIRTEVLPQLRQIQPAVERTIARLGDIVEEEDRFLNGAAAAGLEQCEIPLNGELRFVSVDCEAAFRIEGLRRLPTVLRRRAVRLAVGALGGTVDHDLAQAIADGISGRASGSFTAEGGEVVVEWDAERAHFRRIESPPAYRVPLTLPGETLAEEFGWQVTAFEDILRDDDWDGGRVRQQRMALSTLVGLADLRPGFYLRNPQPGDAMRPIGFDGRRKLSDLLSESKLTQSARRRLPVMCDMIGPIWVPGVCLDERARIHDSADRVLRVRFEPIRPEEPGRPETLAGSGA
ncbi:MAG: tRNA lysidine(34) synthetase TilS [Fimbriimonadaceae bacterium]